MEIVLFQRIQKSLVQKQQNLRQWLQATPPAKKQVSLGPEHEEAVQAHLQVLDEALKRAEEQTLGLCQICKDYVDSKLLEMDYTASVCLDHFSEQERRQLEAELEFLQIVQRALLPQEVPSIPGMDLAVFSRPAHIVSGDYFDFFIFKDGMPGLAIADAMGHGVSASLLMTSLQSALRTLVPEHHSPAEVLRRVNRIFVHNINFTTFVTAFVAKFDPSSGTLTYANAGHNPPLLWHEQEKQPVWLQPTAAAIGLVEAYHLAEKALSLSKGDILLFYTDGVTEATNVRNETFGQRRLIDIVRQNAQSTAQEILRATRQTLSEYSGGQALADDVTLLICKMATG
jgi:sigma-B regulation protein RsbU (phosphoserine phosphatase)